MNIFVCGGIGSGKSTFVNELIKLIDSKPIFGLISKKYPISSNLSEVYIHNVRFPSTSFLKENCVAIIGEGKPLSFPKVFDEYGRAALCDIPDNSFVILDELGFLETNASRFCESVMLLLDRPVTVIGALKSRRTPFLDSIRNHPKSKIYMIDPSNRSLQLEEAKKELRKLLF